MDRRVKIFLENEGNRKEVLVEMWAKGGRERCWLKERDAQPSQGPEEGSDGHPAQDDGRSRMQEDTPEEKRDTMMTELAERVISLEKENRELKKAIHEMEAKAAGQVQAIRATAERCSMLEKGVLEIAQHVRQHEAFDRSVRTSIDGLEKQVQIHQDNFQHVVRIFQNHEQHIEKHGVVSEGIAQYVNALVEESEKTRAWVGSLIRESQAQEEVLRQHEIGQQVLAEVIRRIAVQQTQQQSQPSQGQAIAGGGPTVTELDDDDDPDRLNFMTGPNPHKGPPNGGTRQVTSKAPRAPKPKTIAKRK